MKSNIYIEGVKVEEPLPLRSLFYGEGVFETFRYKNKLPVLFDDHINRMTAGANLLQIPFPDKAYITSNIVEALSDSGIEDAYVKICLFSKGKSLFYESPKDSQLAVIVKEYASNLESSRVKVNSFKRTSTSPIVKVKSLNYLENILARREAISAGFDESLFLNENDEIVECSASNIFWYKENILYTPSAECGLLTGTTRNLIFDCAKQNRLDMEEGKFPLNELLAAEHAFITNSLIGCIPVAEIEGAVFDTNDDIFFDLRDTLFRMLSWV